MIKERYHNGWIFDHSLSPFKKDYLIFGLPIVLGLCIIIVSGQFSETRGSFLFKPGFAFAFIFSIFFDLPHVYSSYVRIGMDHENFSRRKRLYVGLPLALTGVLFAGAFASKAMTISMITYLNMIHRLRQDFGWVMYSRRMAVEPRGYGHLIDKMMVYNLTVFPLLWLHSLSSENAWWMFPGDLLFSVSQFWMQVLLKIHWFISGAYLGWVGICLAKKVPVNFAKVYILGTVWTAWYVGIVFFDGSTWMIDLLHTMPYLFLIYHFCNRKWAIQGVRVWMVYLALVGAAYLTLKIPTQEYTFLFVLILLPSVTHYILDGFIWKSGRSNPDLALVLGFPKPLPVSD
jgi:hypothetical protein